MISNDDPRVGVDYTSLCVSSHSFSWSVFVAFELVIDHPPTSITLHTTRITTGNRWNGQLDHRRRLTRKGFKLWKCYSFKII